MRIDVITVLPELLQGPFDHSILKRGRERGLIEVNLVHLREYAVHKHRTLDDYAYGGGAGMVMQCEPIVNCLQHLKSQRTYDEVIYLSPDGELFNQAIANQLSLLGNVILLCGHYKGIDERVRQHFITREVSIGDYVLSGGELAAGVMVDAIFRLIPGVMNDETSALSDSFQDGLLAPPVYTRPADYNGYRVPDVLLSGNEKLINDWKHEQSLERTKARRPDLYRKWNKE
ncbi:MAG: tRNA (guanosine(37)-N1)-methyltransferase TrmD [Bacteroidetes bacterium]|nr:tRNA (guanosine(37)-N1)-methyltransferase TrmD [Bacteroidota bacterium]